MLSLFGHLSRCTLRRLLLSGIGCAYMRRVYFNYDLDSLLTARDMLFETLQQRTGQATQCPSIFGVVLLGIENTSGQTSRLSIRTYKSTYSMSTITAWGGLRMSYTMPIILTSGVCLTVHRCLSAYWRELCRAISERGSTTLRGAPGPWDEASTLCRFNPIDFCALLP